MKEVVMPSVSHLRHEFKGKCNCKCHVCAFSTEHCSKCKMVM